MSEETQNAGTGSTKGRPGRAQRTGVLITLIAVVGAVTIIDIVTEMIADLARPRLEDHR